MLKRALGLLGDIDLAFPQALDQIVGGDVDQLDGIGTVEDRVGHGLAHANAGDLRDDVVEAFDVLNVDRGVDVDAAVQQLFHVEIAFGVTAARCIGVRQLIDENDLRPPRDDGVEIHLLEALAFVRNAPAGHDFKTLQQRFGLFASVGLHDADDNVVAVLLSGPGLLQHFIGFADTRRGTHEDLELAEASLFATGGLEQCFRRGALVLVAPLICHAASVLTRGLGPPAIAKCRLYPEQGLAQGR